jgi:biopolymer transport protein TolR
VNVTPMIDVLLVLLIIFMVVAPVKPARFDTKVPSKPDAKAPVQAPASLLMVDVGSGSGQNQSVELNSRPVQLPELAAILRELLEERPDKTVYVKAPKAKAYGDVVSVIDAVKGAGAVTVGLQVDFLL